MKRFEGRSIIITGGGSGLGEATAVRLASEGAQLTLVDLNAEGLERTKALIVKDVPDAELEIITANVTQEEDVRGFVERAIARFGKIDGFFNNAGIEGRQNLTENFGLDEFSKVVAVNLNGVFLGMQYVLKHMREQGSGSVVNTASVGGIRGVGNQSGYAASKHGVVGLTRNSAREYGQYGVRINAIAPGAIWTAMVEASLKQVDPVNPKEYGQQFVAVNPMKRFGEPEEVAGLVAFLLSDDSTFINAAVIPIDGGQSAMY
nr:glucose 1-dehydrogenase [Actinomycetales bacterium]